MKLIGSPTAFSRRLKRFPETNRELRTLGLAVDAATIFVDLAADSLEGSSAPEIRGFDIVISVRVKTLVGRYKFIELMDDQKNRT
jgi:hypothetical protein